MSTNVLVAGIRDFRLLASALTALRKLISLSIPSIFVSILSINPGASWGRIFQWMKTSLGAILCFLVASVLGAIGQFLYKAGADRTTASLHSYLFNGRISLGVCCYVAVMVLFVAGFKQHGSPSALYPIYASTFIWAALIDLMAYQKPILPANMTGMILLVLGMYLMGRQA